MRTATTGSVWQGLLNTADHHFMNVAVRCSNKTAQHGLRSIFGHASDLQVNNENPSDITVDPEGNPIHQDRAERLPAV